MLPETGNKTDFKRVLMTVCRSGPIEGEIYCVAVQDSEHHAERFVVTRTGFGAVVVDRELDGVPLSPAQFAAGVWRDLVEREVLKYVGNGT